MSPIWAMNVADDEIDARDRHQPPDLARAQRVMRECAFDGRDLAVKKRDLAQAALHGRASTDIYPNETHHLSLLIDDGGRVGGRDDNDGYVRTAHPGQVAGAATERAGLTAHRTLTA
jgi:hypothetical protein